MKKRVLAGLICMCLLLGSLPMAALAAEMPEEEPAAVETLEADVEPLADADGELSGSCGATENDHVNWVLTPNEDGTGTYTLTISGDGDMADFSTENAAPWTNYCDSITQIDLGTEITYVGSYAFQGCAIESLPWDGNEDAYTNLTSIGEGAFSSCEMLTHVSFVSSIQTYGLYLFAKNTALAQIDWTNYSPAPNGLSNGLGITCVCVPRGMFDGCAALTGTLSLPNNIEAINAEAFRGTGYTVLDFPANMPSVRIINLQAFSASSKPIETLILPSAENHPDTVLGQQAFRNCEFDCEVTVPYYSKTKDIIHPTNGLVVGGNTAHQLFTGSTMKKVILSDGIETVASGTFKGVKGDSFTVLLPKGLKSIGDSAFLGSSIKTITIPEGTSINDNAFHQSTLNSLRIHNNVTVNTSGSNPFNTCQQWAAAILEPDVKQVANGMFSQLLTENSVIYCLNEDQIGCFVNNTNYRSSDSALAVTNGGNFDDDTQFSAGYLENPTKDDFIFGGWYTTSDFKEGTRVEDNKVAKSDPAPHVYPTYYAKWERSTTPVEPTAVRYIVQHYKADKGGYTLVEREVLAGKIGEKVTATPKTYEGYAYNAQKSTASGELKKIESEADIVTLKLYYDMNSTPIVPGDTVRYVVEHYKANKSGYTLAETEVLAGKTGDTVTAVPKTYTGYTHDPHAAGTVAEGTLKKIDSAEDIVTLKLFYGLNVYLVTVESDGHGSASASSASATMGETVTLTAKADSGYRFKAWEVVSGAVTIADDQFTMPAENVTVRAIFQRKSSSSSADKEYSVSVDDGKHGAVSISPKRAEKGDTVTITVRPDKGYELDKLIVTDSKGREIDLREKGENKFTFKMPGSKVTVEATFRAVEEIPEKPQVVNPFVDVNENAYYYDAVLWAVEKGITGGTTAATFSPDEACTRAQMVTFLWHAAGSPVVNYAMSFTDVPADAYYAEAVRWAVSQGITAGTSASTFDPNATVTRGQTVTFLWRAAGSPVVAGDSFADVAADAYYAPAVAWAVREGITAGVGAETFAPSADCTRGQIVTFLYRDMAK